MSEKPDRDIRKQVRRLTWRFHAFSIANVPGFATMMPSSVVYLSPTEDSLLEYIGVGSLFARSPPSGPQWTSNEDNGSDAEILAGRASLQPELVAILISNLMGTTVFFGLVAVLQNLFLLRLGFDARFIGLMLGIGQIVWSLLRCPPAD